jgi:carboxyl-terminal processing protease
MNVKTFLTRIPFIVLSLAVLLVVQSGDALAQADPEYNFEFLWKTYDLNYALFNAKHIDWQALYNIYRPQVTLKTTDDELFAIISKMLGHLNDNHVQFRSSSPQRTFSAGYLWDLVGKGGMEKFRAMMAVRPAPAKYFNRPLKETGNAFFAYGWIYDKIGYFHFNAFADRQVSAKAIDEIMAEFKNADAVIVDVRRNGGGDDQVGKLIAGRFADKKRLYMTTQERNGPDHGDFDPKRHFFSEPNGPIQFTKTVILLTNRFSVSAAENFTLAMRILPHVTVVGDFTSGCFADLQGFRMPNGWLASYSMNLFLDQNGRCWEGIGVPPDIKVKCEYDSTTYEQDPVLETAISLIRSGKLSLQDEEENVRPTQSLASLLEKDITSDGIDKATAKFNDRKANDPGGIYYLDFYEMSALAQKWFVEDKFEWGKAALSLTSQRFPEKATTYTLLGMAYMRQNKKTEALQAFERAVALEEKGCSPQSRQFNDYLLDVLIKEYLAGGIGALDRQYLVLKEEYPLLVTERLLNNLGYLFLGIKLTKPAIEVLDLNVKKFPQSSNVYDSLGEAYMNAGDKKLAIENYEQSLEMDPKNTNAVEKLKELKSK